ncbi:MAG: beta-Ala-His dipeptidase, partial [Lachnospiraceae bacterium]|nr:beta-Ala-His dipeptidase [Lachnospiraceae bacterium]
VMDAKDLEHPEVELIITVDEETGLFGAKAIDISDIKGRRFLNIDSEEEGIFLTSCAGGARVKGALPVDMASVNGLKITVAVKGLQGGHSGVDIHRERGNALHLLARTLYHASKDVDFNIAAFHGGTVENAIPREAFAEVVLAAEDAAQFTAKVKATEEALKAEYATRDAGIYVEIMEEAEDAYAVYSKESTEKLLHLLVAAPVGVQAMSQDVPGLVETSLNLGVVESDEQAVTVQYSVRSSVESAKAALLEKLEIIFKMVGASFKTSGEYPGWAFRVDSPLRDKMVRVYEEMYGVKPEIQAIHAGLECGLFLGKQPDLDCISFGPNMCSIHTTEEKLSISSTKRTWEFLVAVLKDRA